MSAAALDWLACPRSASRPSSAPPATSPRRSSSWPRASRPASPHITLLGATGTGQDLHDRARDRAGPAADAGDRARTSRSPPSSRTSSARSSPTTRSSTSSATTTTTNPRPTSPSDRHLHREGQLGERGDRAAAALGHRRAARPARRPDRGERLVHLRPGLARGVRGADPARPYKGTDIPLEFAMQRLVDIQYQRNNVSRARGTFRVQGDTLEVFPPYETDRLPHRVVGRHRREDHAVRPAHRRAHQGRHRRPHDLPGLALRRVRGPHEARDRHDRGGAARAARAARRRGQAARGRAAAHAHELRPRDDARGRVLQRHRELLAPHRRPRGRAPRPTRCSTTSPTTTSCVLDESHVTRAAAPRDVRGRPVAQVQPRRVRVPAAERDRQPAAALRGVRRARAAGSSSCRRRRAPYELRVSDRSSSRSCAPPASSTPRSRSGRRRARSTT